MASCILLGVLLILPWFVRWYSWRWLPNLAAIPVEDVAAIEVDGTEIPIGDLHFVLAAGTQPELDDSRNLSIWTIQIGERTLKMLTPKFWRKWDNSIGICCNDPQNTPYIEQLRQVYSVTSNPNWSWMTATEFKEFSSRIRCAWGYRSASASRLIIMSRPGDHVCVLELGGRAAEIKIVENETQRIWGFVINCDENLTQAELIDFASRIRIPE